MTTHGEQRLGMLTSSTASVIMRGGPKAWESLRSHLWADRPEDFDDPVGGSRGFGHENEDKGVAKFWERHPDIALIETGGFHIYKGAGCLKNWVGSSPDRRFVFSFSESASYGLEIKSPTSPATVARHTPQAHYNQIQHGMLVTGWRRWYLVVHCGDDIYKEWPIDVDKDWQKRYLQRAEAFWHYAHEDKPVKRRKLSITDIEE